jgi:hypothetical protein
MAENWCLIQRSEDRRCHRRAFVERSELLRSRRGTAGNVTSEERIGGAAGEGISESVSNLLWRKAMIPLSRRGEQTSVDLQGAHESCQACSSTSAICLRDRSLGTRHHSLASEPPEKGACDKQHSDVFKGTRGVDGKRYGSAPPEVLRNSSRITCSTWQHRSSALVA